MIPRFTRKRKVFSYASIIFGCLLCVCAAVIRCAYLVERNYLEQLEQNLEDVASENANALQRSVDLRYDLLKSVAMRFNLEPDKRKENIDRFVLVSEAFNLKRIGFCDRNGIAHATEGKEINLSYREFFQRSIKGEDYISDILKDAMDDSHEMVTIMSTPIYDRNGEIDGIAALTYKSAIFNEQLSHTYFDGNGDIFVFNQHGVVNLSSNRFLLDIYDNIYDVLWGEMGSRFNSRNEMIDSVLEKKVSGDKKFGTISLSNVDYFYHVTPVPLLNGSTVWNVLSIVPADYLQERFYPTKRNLFRMVFFVISFGIISLVTLQLVTVKQRKNARRLAFSSMVTGGPNLPCLCDALNRFHISHGFIVYLQIENFTHTSLAIGNEKSQRVLRAVWIILKEQELQRDFFCHSMNDVFVLYFNENSEILLRNRLQKISRLIHDKAQEMQVSWINVLFGVCRVTKGEDAEETVGKAQIAVKDAKAEHGISFFDKDKQDQQLECQEIEEYFETGLKNEEFKIYLQPKFSTKDKILTGCEALVRWKYKGGDIMSPVKFIPLLETSSKIARLDKYIFRKVCQYQSEWKKQGYKVIPVSVNISKATLYRNRIVEKYCSILQNSGLSPKEIQIEVTETLVNDGDNLSVLLNAFREKGIKVLMDDFGTGYTALSTLNLQCYDTLKMDKSLIDGIKDDFGRQVLAGVIEMTHNLGYYITAEGVEDEYQVDFLKGTGCDDIQGYFYSKPVPAEEFVKFLTKE